ncbi:MAG: peptide ABC transporter substrate-binding protein [Pseudomonadota bacterium]
MAENSAASLNRAALLQLGLLIAASVAALFLLMVLLNWAASATGSDASAAKAVDLEARSISVIVQNEPPQLNSMKATDTDSGQVLGHIMEGLLRYDINNQLAPGVAERWDIRENGATFWLREDAKWSDGEPVTAHDFVFAWRTALDPATASIYAFILYPVKNGEAINRGEAAPETLGVRAASDRRLEIEFEQPVAYFDKLVAFNVYYPVREDFYRSTNGRYGADADEMLYNGAFVLSEWVHNASMRFEKNPHYWDRDSIYLNSIHVPFITNSKHTAVNLFKDGRVAMAELDAETLPDALQQQWHIKRFVDGSVFYLEFNHRPGRVSTNLNFRRAIEMALDPKELVFRVIKVPGYLPGETLFPIWLMGEKTLFRQEYPPAQRIYNPERAREHLEQARVELGLNAWPPLVLLSGDTPISVKQSEHIQAKLRENLGLDMRLDRQIFKQRLEKMKNGEFDIVMAGWGPDFDDPMTFGDLFASWNLQNRGRYNNPKLDAQVRIAQASLEPAVRMRAFGEIQRILKEDAVILPDYERGKVFVQDPRMIDMARRAVGPDPDYSRVRLVDAN